MVFSGEYIWKYTHHGFDFSVLGNTPITFPVEWDRSKIPGYTGRLSVPNVHGFSALVVFSSVAARFFTPQVGGAGATPRRRRESSASTTTRSSTRPPTSSTSPGSAALGWASTGAMTADWWQARCPAPEAIATTVRQAATTVVDTSILSPDQQFQGGLFCGACAPRQPPRSARHWAQSVSGLAVWFFPDQHPGSGNRERRPQSSAHPAAQSVRPCRRSRQPVQRRQIQVERAVHRH